MTTILDRRAVLAGLAALPLLAPRLSLAQASAALTRGFVMGEDAGLVPGSEADQSATLQAAVDLAAGLGLPLRLTGGRYLASGINLPNGSTVSGLAGSTVLVDGAGRPVFVAAYADGVSVSSLVLEGGGSTDGRSGLIDLGFCDGFALRDLTIRSASGNGIALYASAGDLRGVTLDNWGGVGILCIDGAGVTIADNDLRQGGLGGIHVWRDAPGADGTRITGNRIGPQVASSGTNGQEGNGINVFRANQVVVSNNVIFGAAFSAVRLNTAEDCVVSSNVCTDLGEIAIYAEFAFSGSVIADNIVDGAATGISITNFNEGGRLATCSGNIIRNITPVSRSNPDASPGGIYAEADVAITGNVIDAVPGFGILAGWGPYLRDVSVTGNVVRDCDIGIGVSVAEGAGRALVSSNLVSGSTRHAIAGMAWQDVTAPDLAAAAASYPQVTMAANSIG